MRKSIQILCKQNPTVEIPCPNCKKSHTFKSVKFFDKNTHEAVCPDCGKLITYDTTEFAKGFERQLKKLGITW
ncbi:MAG: hypothetical protein E7L17_07415 [Clostridium sp.]|uniref:hypothetical protein n=1 Tax=Clostridium sp. TaxID=1506 RepID=UPI002910A057|nr:hypothetical protein [Clostridium sp.]MDU7337925.1 hypothetical protein [Clostridium sp.]